MLRQTLAVLVLTGLACSDAKGNDTAVDPTPVLDNTTTVTEPATVEPTAPAKNTGAAAVTGTIRFDGDAPERAPIDMSADANCVDGSPDTVLGPGIIRGADGGLADVFIQLTDVPDEKHKAPEEPVVLDQRGCTYAPHVFGMIVKQDIRILNSDATLHNIHAVPQRNKEFNVGMPEKGMEIDKTFKKAEDAITIKCDVHPWMKAYAFCLEHPYFATTAADGSFSLPTEGLPDGEYGVKLWHEVLGETTGSVNVAGGAGTFSFAWTR